MNISETIGSYESDGITHAVAIEFTTSQRFRVVDVTAAEKLLVDEIVDADPDAAIALAEVYLDEIARYLAGERAALAVQHPLGPTPVKISVQRAEAPKARKPRPRTVADAQDALPVAA